jgi:hypothetical protein
MKQSYLNIVNDNQDIEDLEFLVFLTVHGYLMIFGNANLTVDILRRNLNVLESLGYLL